jgi:hypothetical protein
MPKQTARSARAIRILKAVLFALLCLFCLVRLAVHTPYRPFNADEESGLAEAYDYTFVELLVHGPQPELNASPLHYILDRAWLKATEGAHRHVRMALLFRLQVLAYFALGCGFAFLLALALAGSAPPMAAFSFALLASFFFQTNPSLSWCVGLQDRPISLWIMLGFAQVYFLFNSLERRPISFDGRLASLNALLAATSPASGIQVLAAFLVRVWPLARERRWKACRKISWEVYPAFLICAWYGLMSSPQVLDSTSLATFINYWLSAIEAGLWAIPRSLHFIGGLEYGYTWSGNPLLLLAGIPLLALPLWSRNTKLRSIYFYCLLTVSLAVPVTVMSWLWAHSVHPRYFYFIYPPLGLLHLLGVLVLAELLNRHWRHAGACVLCAWVAVQLTIRGPTTFHDTKVALVNTTPIPPYRAEASPLCPRTLGEVRYGPKGGFHARTIDNLCMLGVPAEPMPENPGIPTRKSTRVRTFLSPNEKIE